METFLSILGAAGVIIGIFAALILICLLGTSALYESVFGKRFEIYDSPILPDLNDYPFLENDPVTFPAKRGYNYVGYYYYDRSVTDFKGLIVISHGIFDGHLNYLPEIAYFARNGYKIFAFDNTGSHMTGGKSLRGLPQSAEDLNTALQFITKENTLPLFLFGHSWGGYAVSAVHCYNTYDIKGVFVQNGFNLSYSMVTEEGARLFGKWMLAFTPYIKLYERLKYGKAAKYTATAGIAKATANGTKFLIMHSLDDKTISISNSVLANVIKNDSITLITEKNKGHQSLDSDRAIKHRKKIDDRCFAELGKNPKSSVKREFYAQHVDRKLYYELDMRLIKKVQQFYDSLI